MFCLRRNGLPNNSRNEKGLSRPCMLGGFAVLHVDYKSHLEPDCSVVFYEKRLLTNGRAYCFRETVLEIQKAVSQRTTG